MTRKSKNEKKGGAHGVRRTLLQIVLKNFWSGVNLFFYYVGNEMYVTNRFFLDKIYYCSTNNFLFNIQLKFTQ